MFSCSHHLETGICRFFLQRSETARDRARSDTVRAIFDKYHPPPITIESLDLDETFPSHLQGEDEEEASNSIRDRDRSSTQTSDEQVKVTDQGLLSAGGLDTDSATYNNHCTDQNLEICSNTGMEPCSGSDPCPHTLGRKEGPSEENRPSAERETIMKQEPNAKREPSEDQGLISEREPSRKERPSTEQGLSTEQGRDLEMEPEHCAATPTTDQEH